MSVVSFSAVPLVLAVYLLYYVYQLYMVCTHYCTHCAMGLYGIYCLMPTIIVPLTCATKVT